MAAIRKRGDYQWQAEIRRKGYPTQRRTFETKADAEKWAAVVESEIARNVFRPHGEAEKTTLDECLKRYLKEVTPLKKGAGPKLEEGKIGIIRADTGLCGKPMTAVRGVDVAAYRDKRLKSVGPATVIKELNIISHLFNTAIREWGMESLVNPVAAVRKPKAPKGRERRLQPGELDAILAATESLELPAILQLELETAMRRSEIVGLIWKNINLKKRFLFLPDTKNGEARAVPLSSQAVKLLEAIPRRLSGRVFGMTPSAVTHAFVRARKRARTVYEEDCRKTGKMPDKAFLSDLRLHDLRHEATSRLFESGRLDMMEVASITGHKTLSMLKRYTHLRAEELAKKLG